MATVSDVKTTRRSRRTEILEARPVNRDGFVEEWPEVGLIAMESPHDPKPSIRVQDGMIVEMDGKDRAEFDFIDQFIADHAIDVAAAERAMSMSSAEIAQLIVDPRVPRDEVVAIARGLTPEKLLSVLETMNVVEMMMGMQKMRARRTPSNQAHSTSVRDNPLQVAVDAAEAALRGFDELETTIGVVRYAPLVALGLQVGGQTGRGGVMTQCALEEATELKLGMRGLTGYAETISVYGTERVFMDVTTPHGRRRSWPRRTPRVGSRCASPPVQGPRCRWATPRASRCCTSRSAA
jgi:propanediol dehydratase large subunit